MGWKYEPETRCITVFIWRDEAGYVDVLGVTPSVLRAYRGDDVVWDLVANADDIKVEVKEFTRKRQKALPIVKPPKEGGAKTKKGARISSPIEVDTDEGDFKYEIWIEGAMAFDPELQIREKA